MKRGPAPRTVSETDEERKMYEQLFGEAKSYVDGCGYRVCSTDLPFRFLESWIQPIEPDDRDAVRQHALRLSHHKLFRSRVPVDLFAYVYEKRSFPEGKELLRRRFEQFQLLLRYVSMLYMIRTADRMRRFDLFDVENYDELVEQIFADLHDGTLPRINYRPFF